MRRSLILLALVAGCSRSGAPAPDAAPAPLPNPPLVQTPTNTADLMATMFARLKDEAEHRPSGTPMAEAVLDALEAAGVPTLDGQQVLAAIANAKYCWQSQTQDGALGFSICEFESEAARAKGEEIMRAGFGSFGPRSFLINGRTMMTIKELKPDAKPTLEKVMAAFARVK